MPKQLSTRCAAASAAGLALLLAWDASGLDMPLARLVGGVHGFPWRDDWLLSQVAHDAVRIAAWAVVLLLCVNVVWPVGSMARLGFSRRVQLPASALLATATVLALKGLSGTSCPFDLSDFGGVARLASHWRGWTATDGGGGHCFPAGHAAAGFAFVGGYFALRDARPRLARTWLWVALSAGLLAGGAQQWRGAHFMSHTLWTAWLCWTVAWLSDPLFRARPGAAPALDSPAAWTP